MRTAGKKEGARTMQQDSNGEATRHSFSHSFPSATIQRKTAQRGQAHKLTNHIAFTIPLGSWIENFHAPHHHNQIDTVRNSVWIKQPRTALSYLMLTLRRLT